VRGDRDIDSVVHVEPLRMMVSFLGHECDPRHKRKRFAEVTEQQRPFERLTVAVPQRMGPKPNLDLIVG